MEQNNIINTFNTIKEVEDYRATINEMCDKRKEFITLCEQANNLTTKSFGYIKESFEAISPELFKTKEGKKIMNKYTKAIRENKGLSTLHTIHENIRKVSSNTDIDFFIQNLVTSNNNINIKEIKEDTKKLGRILAEGYLLVGCNAASMLPTENTSFENAIYFIAENKKTNKHLAEYSDAMKIIREHISSKKQTKNIFEAVNLDTMANNLIQEFNLKFSDKLTINEMNILKEINESDNRESVFNKYKNTCVEKISEAKKNFEIKGDKSSSDRLKMVLEQLSNKIYTADTLGADVCGFIELSNIFE